MNINAKMKYFYFSDIGRKAQKKPRSREAFI